MKYIYASINNNVFNAPLYFFIVFILVHFEIGETVGFTRATEQ